MIPIETSTNLLEARIEGSCGWLVLNRPERRNALNAEMWAAIPPVLKALDENPSVRVIVVRGAGQEAFAAGADISEFATARNSSAAADQYQKLNSAALAAIRGCSRPVIAMITGYCIGGGVAIAMAADLRIADQSARFALPPARLGLAYPLDSLKDLVTTIGPAATKDMIFTGRQVKAEEALRLGLVNRIATDIEADMTALTAEIGEGAPFTLTHAKRAIDFLTGRPGHEDDAEVAWLGQRCFDSEDYAEGRSAFMEKRKPLFRGS
jgi:enoyl-CoA hydratase